METASNASLYLMAAYGLAGAALLALRLSLSARIRKAEQESEAMHGR